MHRCEPCSRKRRDPGGVRSGLHHTRVTKRARGVGKVRGGGCASAAPARDSDRTREPSSAQDHSVCARHAIVGAGNGVTTRLGDGGGAAGLDAPGMLGKRGTEAGGSAVQPDVPAAPRRTRSSMAALGGGLKPLTRVRLTGGSGNLWYSPCVIPRCATKRLREAVVSQCQPASLTLRIYGRDVTVRRLQSAHGDAGLS